MWSWWSEILRDPTRVGVVAAWFTGGAALVGVVISAVVSTIVSRRSVYINAVTSERSKWIEALRGTISSSLPPLIASPLYGRPKQPTTQKALNGQRTRRNCTDL